MRDIGLLTCAVAGLVAGATAARGDDAKTDKERLQGTWTMVSLEINGEPVQPDQVENARLLVEGDHYTPIYDDRVISESFVVRPGADPKEIDFVYTDGPRKGEAVKGIYRLEGDRYVMCRTTRGEDERPKAFATRPESGLSLVVWRRLTREEDVKRKAIDTERKTLDGTWVGVIGLRDGLPVVDDEARRVRLSVNADRYTLERGDRVDKGTSAIDPTAFPKAIDIKVVEGEDAGRTWKGIYEVIGDVHKVCFAAGGKDRPTRFASEPGSGHILWVFARPPKPR